MAINKIYFTFFFIIYFLYIYVVPMPIIGNTSNLLPLLMFPIAFIVANKEFMFLIRSKLVILFSLVLIFFTIYVFSIGAFYLTNDFRMGKTLINLVYSFFGIIVFVSIFYHFYSSESELYSLLEKSFFIQLFFIILMLLVPDIRDTIQSLTKTEESIKLMSQYGGIRGLGITSFAAFGLSVIFTLFMFIIFYRKFTSSDGNVFFKLLLFVIILLPSITAGRIVIVSVIALIFALIILKPKYLIHLSILAIVGISFVFYTIQADLIEYGTPLWLFYQFAFQGFYTYLDTGSFSYSSTDNLASMYFFPGDMSFFLGDGKYENSSGGYYMGTDAGFMRFILMGGMPLSIFIYSMFLLLCVILYNNIKSHIKHPKTFIYSFILLSVLLHFKGEVILFNVSFMKIMFTLIFFYFLINNFPKKHKLIISIKEKVHE